MYRHTFPLSSLPRTHWIAAWLIPIALTGPRESIVRSLLRRIRPRCWSRRTTRRIGLTEAGRLYLEQTRAAFSLIDDAEAGFAVNELDGVLVQLAIHLRHFKAGDE
jgi:hypothetical protein